VDKLLISLQSTRSSQQCGSVCCVQYARVNFRALAAGTPINGTRSTRKIQRVGGADTATPGFVSCLKGGMERTWALKPSSSAKVSRHYLKIAPCRHRKEEEKLEETKQKEEKFLSERRPVFRSAVAPSSLSDPCTSGVLASFFPGVKIPFFETGA